MTETTDETQLAGFEETSRSDRKAWATTWLSLLGALAMTSCCILPLVLVSLGVTGVFIAQLGALYQYKWVTFAFSAAVLGYGFWKAYSPTPTASCADGTCSRPVDRTLMRTILWSATAITAVAMLFPYVTPYILKY